MFCTCSRSISFTSLTPGKSRNGFLGRDSAESSRRGAASRTAWAIVPSIPNELTPARRGVVSTFHSERVLYTWNEVFANSIPRIWLFEVQARRQFFVFKRQDGLDKPSHSSGRSQTTDVCFRPEQITKLCAMTIPDKI